MADVTPRLNPTGDTNANRYAPLAGLAMAAFAVALLFLLVLGGFGIRSALDGKPLLSIPILVLAGIGFVLAFLGLREIKTSENAKTGTVFANAAWWICLVGGLCYFAYMMAVEWSIRSEAEKLFKSWTETYAAADPSKPNDESLRKAFLKSLEPGNVASVESNPKRLEVEYGVPLAMFRTTGLLMLAHRNRDQYQIIPQGLESWEQTEDGLVCVAAGMFTCPEGEFPLKVTMRAVPGEKRSKIWQISLRDQFVTLDADKRPIGNRTRYGWLIYALEASAQRSMEEVLESLNGFYFKQPLERSDKQFEVPPGLGQAIVKRFFIDPAPTGLSAVTVGLTGLERFQLMGGAGLFYGDPSLPPENFFSREDGAALSQEDRKTLVDLWMNPRRTNITPPGVKSSTLVIRNTIVDVSEKQIVFHVPFEASPQTPFFAKRPKAFTTGRFVFVCDDPTVLDEVNAARKSGGSQAVVVPQDLLRKRFPMRLIGIQSNLMPLEQAGPEGGGGPGGPPPRGAGGPTPPG